MADLLKVPQDLAERFLPCEQARFELVKENGEVRLWRSVCRRTDVEGRPLEYAHHHVVKGEELAYWHMRELCMAEEAYDLVLEQARR